MSFGVNFINILLEMHTDPKSVKIQSSCQFIFALLGSVLLKALSKTLMKLNCDAKPLEYPLEDKTETL